MSNITSNWMKIIRDNDPWLLNNSKPTGMSWGSIKRVRKVSREGRTFSSFNAYENIDVGDRVIIKIIGSNALFAGSFTRINWGNTLGLEMKQLEGHKWVNLFWIEDGMRIGTFRWSEHQVNLDFLRNFNKISYAFQCGMWKLPESDYLYITNNTK